MNTKHFLFLLIFSANSAFGEALQGNDEETDAKIERLTAKIDQLTAQIHSLKNRIEVLEKTQKECQANCQSKIDSVKAKNAIQDKDIDDLYLALFSSQETNAAQNAAIDKLRNKLESIEVKNATQDAVIDILLNEIKALKKTTSASSTTTNIEEDNATFGFEGLEPQ